jgi:RNA polymerase sigma-70 factor (ECF subfamily)
VFLEVWRAAAEYDEARGSVRAWLIMRMRSRSLDRRKAAGFARVV